MMPKIHRTAPTGRAIGLGSAAAQVGRWTAALLHQRRRRAGAGGRRVLLGGRRADPERMGHDRNLFRRMLEHAHRASLPDRREAIPRHRAKVRE